MLIQQGHTLAWPHEPVYSNTMLKRKYLLNNPRVIELNYQASRKLGVNVIETMRGLGYRLSPPDQHASDA